MPSDTPTPHSHPVALLGVGVFLYRTDGSFLIGLRQKAGEAPCWCLPGGHVEAGETFATAAVRELQEETGIQRIGQPQVFALFQDIASRQPHAMVGVAIAALPGCDQDMRPEPGVFAMWQWVQWVDLPGPLFGPSQVLLQYLRQETLPAQWKVHPVVAGQIPRTANGKA